MLAHYPWIEIKSSNLRQITNEMNDDETKYIWENAGLEINRMNGRFSRHLLCPSSAVE